MGDNVRHYTDPRRLLRYALDNPRRAARIAAVLVVVLLITAAALVVDAVPTWIVGYVFAAVVLFLAYRAIKRVLLVRAATEDDAGSLSAGPATVHGTVVPATDELLRAPHSGTPCVAYRHEFKRDHDDDPGTGDSPLTGADRTETETVPFYVEDDTGRALVNPADGRLELKRDEGKRLFALADRGVRESYLEPGDTVAVYGEGVRPDVGDAAAAVAGGGGTDRASGRGATDDQASDGTAVSFQDGMRIPPEFLPDGVDSLEELQDAEGKQSLEEIPPQYREYARRTVEESGFTGGPFRTADRPSADSDRQPTSDGPQADTRETGPILRRAAETAAEFPGRYDHLFADEDLVLGRGPAYETVLITDKSGIRVYAKQVLVTLALTGVGLALVALSAAWMLGFYPFG